HLPRSVVYHSVYRKIISKCFISHYINIKPAMNSSSDGDYSEMEINDNGEWRKVQHKRKRDKKPNSPTQQHPKKQAFPSARNTESTQVAYQDYHPDNYQTTGNSNDVIHVPHN
ncbi:hypothetical protein HHI36_011509, partial [Cryptolaemus montrouzieri]